MANLYDYETRKTLKKISKALQMLKIEMSDQIMVPNSERYKELKTQSDQLKFQRDLYKKGLKEKRLNENKKYIKEIAEELSKLTSKLDTKNLSASDST